MVVADGPRGAMAGGALSKHPSCQPLRVNAKKKNRHLRVGVSFTVELLEKRSKLNGMDKPYQIE
jgi:hypothetical protein